MYGCILQPKNGSLATLAIRGSEGSLEIACTAQMPNQPLPQVKVNLCVFSTSVGTDAAIGRLKTVLLHCDTTRTVEVTGQSQLRIAAPRIGEFGTTEEILRKPKIEGTTAR